MKRIENIKLINKYFEKKHPTFQHNWNKIFVSKIHLVAEFEHSQKYRLVEDYGIECLRHENGKLIFEFDFTNKEYLLSWIMGFGEKVTILSPEAIKEKHKQIFIKMVKKYL